MIRILIAALLLAGAYWFYQQSDGEAPAKGGVIPPQQLEALDKAEAVEQQLKVVEQQRRRQLEQLQQAPPRD